MAINLNDAEYFADTISKRVDILLNERDVLRREISRHTNGNLENNKAFVRIFQENILISAMNEQRITKLERILLMRG
ncbi:MAG: hypothetical protein IJ597_01640 [Synergistaceae bacterium]|nr:hypothetical protein [Synergistaceae bacterium]